jgi:hypothetical protein
MSESKQRGTYEQRKAEGILKRKQAEEDLAKAKEEFMKAVEESLPSYKQTQRHNIRVLAEIAKGLSEEL